ncbi:ELWxxDGT repeat protein [Archangium gephyra]|uniref:ELWxxDGT repeat protein n=1 Tax=Archangium gephyra TaxID=48 RepID=UPI003B7A6F5B
MRRLRGSLGCLAVVLAAMSGCSDPGQGAPGPVPVAPVQRSAHLVGTPGLVSDLQPTPPPDRTHSYPKNFVVMGTTRFFTASDPMHGRELWKSDGTPAGTVLVADITPGREDSTLSDFTLAHGVLYFVEDGIGADERLWRSDGTAEGTRPVFTDPASPLIVSDAVAFKGTLYLVASSDFGRSKHLWTSDGTREGTTVVKTFPPGRAPWGLSRMGERLFFTADDGVHGSEPWVSDGTAAGTVMLKDLAPGSTSSSLRSFAVAGSVFYFTLGVAFSGTQLWKSDGTSEGTVPLSNVPGEPIAVPGGPRLMDLHWLMFSGGTLFFSANDNLAGQEALEERWHARGHRSGEGHQSPGTCLPPVPARRQRGPRVRGPGARHRNGIVEERWDGQGHRPPHGPPAGRGRFRVGPVRRGRLARVLLHQPRHEPLRAVDERRHPGGGAEAAELHADERLALRLTRLRGRLPALRGE